MCGPIRRGLWLERWFRNAGFPRTKRLPWAVLALCASSYPSILSSSRSLSSESSSSKACSISALAFLCQHYISYCSYIYGMQGLGELTYLSGRTDWCVILDWGWRGAGCRQVLQIRSPIGGGMYIWCVLLIAKSRRNACVNGEPGAVETLAYWSWRRDILRSTKSPIGVLG